MAGGPGKPSVGYANCATTSHPARLESLLLKLASLDLAETLTCTTFCPEISRTVMFSSLAKILQMSVRTSTFCGTKAERVADCILENHTHTNTPFRPPSGRTLKVGTFIVNKPATGHAISVIRSSSFFQSTSWVAVEELNSSYHNGYMCIYIYIYMVSPIQ